MEKNIFKDAVEAPALMIDKAANTTKKVNKEIASQEQVKVVRGYLDTLGPGLVTGAADDDPSGIATYSQAGAQFGFKFLWLALFTFPLMSVVQEMCARIGLETGRGLAGNIRIHFPRSVIYSIAFLLFLANALNLGVDLGAMAKAVQLIYPGFPFSLAVVGLAVISLIMQIAIPYKQYIKYLKILVIVLFSYVIAAFLSHLDWKDAIYHTIVPSFSFRKEELFLICAILGTTISPYLFFWQTSHEIEEEILKGKTSIKLREGSTPYEIKEMRIDVWSGMLISNIITFFIIATTAGTLFANGITNIATASDAALALRPLAGEYTFLLFALGIIGTGLLAVPVLAGSASYAVAESFFWKEGLYRKLKSAPGFYGVIIISVIVGLLINFTGIDIIKALIYSALVNGLIAPIVLVFIVLISSNKKIMGKRVNHPVTTAIGWTTVFLMAVSGIAAIISLF